MTNSPGRRNSNAFPTLGSERSGSAMPHFDMDDDISSRPGSVYSNYNNMNATSLNAALSHHLHFETVSPFTNSRQKKKRDSGGVFGTRGRKSRGKTVEYGMNTGNSNGSLEDTEQNMALKELASR